MTESLVLELVDKRLVTNQLVLTVGYDIESLKDPNFKQYYHGEIKTDRYGRSVPKSAHGTANLSGYSSSTKQIVQAVMDLYDRIVDRNLLVRRMYMSANRVIDEASVPKADSFEQLDLFTNYAAVQEQREKEAAALEREKKMQKAILAIQNKYGKNAILKGSSLEDGATARERNGLIGGHRS